MTATYEISRDLGLPYFEKLAQQNVMAGAVLGADPPKKLALGERAVDCGRQRDKTFFQIKEAAARRARSTTEGVAVVGPIRSSRRLPTYAPGCSIASASAAMPSTRDRWPAPASMHALAMRSPAQAVRTSSSGRNTRRVEKRARRSRRARHIFRV